MQFHAITLNSVPEASYLTAENAWRYRAIMRTFYLESQKAHIRLNKTELLALLRADAHFGEYTAEQLEQDLNALCGWRNLVPIQDPHRPTSIAEYKNKQFSYSMSQTATEIERMTISLENLDLRTAILSSQLFERILDTLERMTERTGADARTLNQLWDQLQWDFRQLTNRYQDYLRDFYSGKTEKLMKSVEFMVHKDKFIKYLNEFVQELQRHSKRMEQLLEKNSERMENTILERVVESELDIPHALLEIHGNAEPSIRENVYGKWYSLKNWFVDGQGQECEAKKVLKITSDIIRNIIQNAALIVQVQNWGISRKDDYKKFLELFLKCEDLEEAHKLSAHVFGVQQIEHYKTNLPREEDSINNSVYQEEPSIFLLKPHTRGYRERKDRTGFADKTLEKMAQRESYLRQAQKQKEVVLRYIREHKIRFAEIDEVVSEDTRAIFLQWIAQANMSSEKTGRTEYGQEYQLKRKDGSCVLKCEDGDLKMPDYTLEFK